MEQRRKKKEKEQKKQKKRKRKAETLYLKNKLIVSLPGRSTAQVPKDKIIDRMVVTFWKVGGSGGKITKQKFIGAAFRQRR